MGEMPEKVGHDTAHDDTGEELSAADSVEKSGRIGRRRGFGSAPMQRREGHIGGGDEEEEEEGEERRKIEVRW
jgi:hypothetical protein